MKTILTLLAMMCVTAGYAQDAKQQQLATGFAASTGQPYDLCLKAVMIRDWCVANPQGGVLNGTTYDAAATAQLLHKSMVILGLELPSAPVPATPATPPASLPMGTGLADRAPRQVGRSMNDPQRRAEMEARNARTQQGTAQTQSPVVRREIIGEAIKTAISQRRMLLISTGGGGGTLVEPHLLGVTPAGNWAMQAWVVEGAVSGSSQNGFRIYSLDQISTIELTDRFFNPRPGYNPNGQPVFKAVQTSL
ncbi:hypothetical protein [Prosthecobacter sp.]|uniref:hypothetical protein n=1 Tax=Prosthecobacter sp. TaxID=1965333 RepID=UPI00378493C8